ncbi:MAG: N-acetylglucosamine-6-phosphate deacetylase [Acidobacteria bacterium]|jgi:N-acetylglucosamine-6-phosphate deacetylase|nr:MAG: N-acetylglucosamine-6-phosphate deacetylase [Acidobacteriota bacterium]GIU80982.1 MAG: N-acetylglucosamine-6-phosphate deacetylase [Pyrinomonadaceae bacterium]
MPSLVLKNAYFVLPDRVTTDLDVLIENGRIADIGSNLTASKQLDCKGLTILPGFIDIHNHGAIGIDVNEADVAGLYNIGRFLASQGVTSWLPTIVPDRDEVYQRIIASIDELMSFQEGEPIAKIVGVHYEGIFANKQMCGALRPEFFRAFSGNELESLPRLKNGIHLMTLAPEIQGGIDLTRKLRQSGWIPLIGHTKADSKTLDAAFEAGARHLTHFFNAMTGLHHRELGVVGWGLTKDEVTFDIIADGVHVAPQILHLACRTKTPEKVLLISDSVAPTGLGDGTFQLWGGKISVENKRTKNEQGNIAGSVITMHDAFKNVVSLGFSLVEASIMASANPAKLLGLQDEIGAIKIGSKADLIALNKRGERTFTMLDGKIFW